MRDPGIVDVVRRHAIDVDIETAGSRLLDAIDPGASLVLIGESTHGTHDFYRIRANLTRALIQRRGFTCVAAEADWPDAYRAKRTRSSSNWSSCAVRPPSTRVDRTRAVEPLERWAHHEVDLPETYPTGV
jgi:erythromycin esterase-like protein